MSKQLSKEMVRVITRMSEGWQISIGGRFIDKKQVFNTTRRTMTALEKRGLIERIPESLGLVRLTPDGQREAFAASKSTDDETEPIAAVQTVSMHFKTFTNELEHWDSATFNGKEVRDVECDAYDDEDDPYPDVWWKIRYEDDSRDAIHNDGAWIEVVNPIYRPEFDPANQPTIDPFEQAFLDGDYAALRSLYELRQVERDAAGQYAQQCINRSIEQDEEIARLRDVLELFAYDAHIAAPLDAPLFWRDRDGKLRGLNARPFQFLTFEAIRAARQVLDGDQSNSSPEVQP